MAKFVKGQSGNPGGRPKVVTAIKELAQQHGESAFQRIIGLMASDDERVALAASQEVLNRAYGKPVQATELTGKDGADLLTGVKITLIKADAGKSRAS